MAARTLILAALTIVSSAASAEEIEPGRETPLFDYANSQPTVTRPIDTTFTKEITAVEAEFTRHPPPPDAECAHTLGASRFARMYDDVGVFQSNIGDYDAAIISFQKALACTPRVANLYAELASEFLHKGRLAEARATLAKGTAIDAESAALDSVIMQLDFIEERWAESVSRLRAMIAQTDDERATYYLCFLWLAQRRAGVKQPDLVTRTNEYDEWPAPILETLNGSRTEQELLEAVLEEKNEIRRRQLLVEALFYIGQRRLADGEALTARRYFATVVNQKVLQFIEHHLALAELVKMQQNSGD